MKAYIYLIMFLLLIPLAYAETTGDIYGEVRDNIGNPVLNAKIEIVEKNLTLYTSENGSFRFNNITFGQYTIKVSKQGYQSHQSLIEVIAGTTTSLNIVLTISGGVDNWLLDLANKILSYGWWSLAGSSVAVLLLVILSIYLITGIISKIFLEGFLVFIALFPAIVLYLTYGLEAGLSPLYLMLFPYIYDNLLGMYSGINQEVVNMCLVMLFVSYLSFVQIGHALVKKKEYPLWMIPIIGFIGLIGLGLGLQNFWNYAFTYFAMPLIAILVIIAFTFTLTIFIKVKKSKRGITVTG